MTKLIRETLNQTVKWYFSEPLQLMCIVNLQEEIRVQSV